MAVFTHVLSFSVGDSSLRQELYTLSLWRILHLKAAVGLLVFVVLHRQKWSPNVS